MEVLLARQKLLPQERTIEVLKRRFTTGGLRTRLPGGIVNTRRSLEPGPA